MIWVVVCALIVSVAFNVLFAVLVSRQSSQSLLVLDRSHARTIEYTGDILNRLMVKDWTQYLDLTATIPAHDEEESALKLELVPTLGPDRGGFSSRLGLRGWTPDDTVAINPEDDMP